MRYVKDIRSPLNFLRALSKLKFMPPFLRFYLHTGRLSEPSISSGSTFLSARQVPQAQKLPSSRLQSLHQILDLHVFRQGYHKVLVHGHHRVDVDLALHLARRVLE